MLSMLNLEKEIQKSRCPRFPAPFSRLPKWDLENGAKKRGRLASFFGPVFWSRYRDTRCSRMIFQPLMSLSQYCEQSWPIPSWRTDFFPQNLAKLQLLLLLIKVPKQSGTYRTGGYSLKHGVRGCSKVLRCIFINFGIPMGWFWNCSRYINDPLFLWWYDDGLFCWWKW